MNKKTKLIVLLLLVAESFCFSNAIPKAEEISQKPDFYSLQYTVQKPYHLTSEEEYQNLKVRYSLTLPDFEREEVQKFRELFLKPQYKSLLKSSLEDSMDLRLFVRKTLENEGLPPELEYLPVVESYYKTTAKSRSGAIGLWQFMKNSVSPYLVLNDYVDERLDPWKETQAAVKKLKENYNMFGDWLIAIAAYNCGAGAMSRALAKADIKTFWYLAENKLIPEQTIQYIPKLLAIADLCINTNFYNMDISLHQEEYETLYNETNGLFDYVTVNKPYSLKVLAQSMRIDYDILKKLNPSFIEGYTHPTLESTIRVPIGMAETAKEALSKIEPLEIPAKYVVVKGDTLWGIAKRNNITVKKLCELNNIKENSILSIGKILYIPAK